MRTFAVLRLAGKRPLVNFVRGVLMCMRFSSCLTAGLVLTIVFSINSGLIGASVLEDPQPALKIGDAAPDWKELPGTDDKKHSLADLHDQRVVVIVFTCNSCPYSVDYEDRIIELQKKYADHKDGVKLVAINSSKKPTETLENMKARANDKEFPFAYLVDETQQVAESYSAGFTPEFFVLNKDRQVVYKGALDDKTNATEVKVKYVELAIEAALKGESPEMREVPARGCAIRYQRARK